MTDTTTGTVPEQAAAPEATWPEALGATRIAEMLAELTGEPVRAEAASSLPALQPQVAPSPGASTALAAAVDA